MLIPGGWGTRAIVEDSGMLAALRELSTSADYVASVCTGSAVLARAGILDGKKATTNKEAFDWVATQGPGVAWMRKARWVEDGKFWTSSGVSAGMDMSIAMIERIAGPDNANAVARFAEYNWNSDPHDDPFTRPG